MTMTADDYDQQIMIEHEPIVTKGSAASPLIGKERFRGFSCSYGPSLNVHWSASKSAGDSALPMQISEFISALNQRKHYSYENLPYHHYG